VTLPGSYFDAVYADHPDPWRFASRWYERRKRDLTVAALPEARFRRAFEPGCSIGLLTELLAPRCDELLATDVAARAVSATRDRLAGTSHVRVERMAVPDSWPDGSFDLVVLSEVGYYLSHEALARLVGLAAAALEPGGALVACHWRHAVSDYPLPGDAVHVALREHPALGVLARHEEHDFLLDVLTPRPVRSVAAREGLLG
jgi:SAM-dependent methyltransferase